MSTRTFTDISDFQTGAAGEPSARSGMYRAPIIQEVIETIYFKSPRDLGVVYADVYRTMPLHAVALTLTAVCSFFFVIFASQY